MSPRLFPPNPDDLRLCEALGLDPARVIRFEWDRPGKVRAVILDDPIPGAEGFPRHTEEHDLPEGWR